MQTGKDTLPFPLLRVVELFFQHSELSDASHSYFRFIVEQKNMFWWPCAWRKQVYYCWIFLNYFKKTNIQDGWLVVFEDLGRFSGISSISGLGSGR